MAWEDPGAAPSEPLESGALVSAKLESLGKLTMKKVSGIGVAAVVVWFALQATSQAPHRIALHAGHVLDVKSGKMLSDQTLILESGKIVSAGPSAEAKIPSDATRIDLPNATVLPGLIDAHTHLTMIPSSASKRWPSPSPDKLLPEPRMLA
jgi:cytosine/adenosine deaminase-related metal-dependent hydrolase